MEVSLLLFLKKEVPNARLKTRTQNMLKSIFNDKYKNNQLLLNTSLWDKKAESVDITVGCNIYSRPSNSSIVLSIDDSKKNSILALEYAINRIIYCDSRSDFYITKSYDELSQYLSEKLYGYLTSFERKLRRLIYEIVIKSYGGEWFDKTFSNQKELHTKISKNSRKDKIEAIENSLEEMTYGDLITYLFTEVPNKSLESIINDELAPEKIESLNKEELVAHIELLRPRSLWDRLFSEDANLSNLQEDIKKIHNIRNKVMHAKTLKYDQFIKSRSILNIWISKLDNKYDEIKNVDYSSVDILQVINSFSIATEALLESVMPNIEVIAEAQKAIAFTVGEALKVVSSIDYSWINNLIDISTGISNLLENTNIGMFNDIVKNIPLLLDPLNEDRNDDDEDNNDE